jgi:DNA mismatch repair protein MutH
MSGLFNNNFHHFDEYSQKSILEFAKRLEGRTLREFLSNEEIDSIKANILAHPGNKGKLGHNIEKFYFKYDLNSASEADFPCDLELKVTPIKYIKNGELRPKERLVCNIINFMDIVHESWGSSTFLEKNRYTLLIRYIDPINKSITLLDYKIFDVQIFDIFENPDDARQFEKDWNIIVNKVKDGIADDISESDTLFLGACTKGANREKSYRKQPFNSEKARQRAFAFKQQFMAELLRRKLN